jgi:hypothetical protein
VQILAHDAAEAICAYKTTFRDGQLRFFWRTTHNLFRCGVAMTYCVQVQSTHHYPGLDQAKMTASVNTCVSILWAMVERYPAGRAYRDAFESLAASVLTTLGSNGNLSASALAQERGAFGYESFADLALPRSAINTLYWGFGALT